MLLVLAAPHWRDDGVGPLVWLLVFVAMCAIRAPHEEAMMRARFGDAWRDDCARAGRLLPKPRT